MSQDWALIVRASLLVNVDLIDCKDKNRCREIDRKLRIRPNELRQQIFSEEALFMTFDTKKKTKNIRANQITIDDIGGSGQM